MTIESYIQTQVLLPRLREKGVLVVYDPEGRYRALCLGVGGEKVAVVDASVGSIEAREKAQEALIDLGSGKSKVEGLIVYTAAPKPEEEERKQRDPFATYEACGRVFPDGDGDSFENLCLKARPEHAVEVRKVFATNNSPDFSIINKIGGGPGWPQLQAVLGKDSASSILLSLLAPRKEQKEGLQNAGDSWVGEARDLFASCLGLKLLTKGKTWSSIAEELWRFLLFSEFVFDLPGALPPSLSNVPRAGGEARQLVENLCDDLRHDGRTSTEYVRRAEEIEQELHLPEVCGGIDDLGIRDTFPFEERTFLHQAQKALLAGDLDRVRTIVAQHASSVWRTKGENQAQWGLIGSAATLVERCEDLQRGFPGSAKDMPSLIRYYSGHLRVADRLHREFEQAVEGYLDAGEDAEEVVRNARRVYRSLMNDAQDLFLRFFEGEGWPVSGMEANWDTFDRHVAPLLLEKGNRVAMILVDALRYELGFELKRQIADEGNVEIEPVCAAMPTVTPVGMASLLPEAGSRLHLRRRDDAFVPFLGDVKVAGLQERMKILLEKFGQRFQEMKLTDFIKSKKNTVPERVDLLVLRTTELDTQMELSPQMSAPVVSTLQRVRLALNRLRRTGFHHVVIATDHGFVLNATAESGDVCRKPVGDWLNVHDRAVLGSVVGDSGTLVLPADRAGIRGDFECFGTPRTLSPYKAGLTYFHGGASLQEAVVPVISVKLSKESEAAGRKIRIELGYRNGAVRITTQRPVVDITAVAEDLFTAQENIEVILEACDSRGRVVGEAKPGGVVNPATGILQLPPGEKVQVPLKMVPMEEFEGKFTVKVLNPSTMVEYCEGLKLETDYTG